MWFGGVPLNNAFSFSSAWLACSLTASLVSSTPATRLLTAHFVSDHLWMYDIFEDSDQVLHLTWCNNNTRLKLKIKKKKKNSNLESCGFGLRTILQIFLAILTWQHDNNLWANWLSTITYHLSIHYFFLHLAKKLCNKLYY